MRSMEHIEKLDDNKLKSLEETNKRDLAIAHIEMRNGAINNPVIKNETIPPYCKIFPIDISLFLNVHLQL